MELRRGPRLDGTRLALAAAAWLGGTAAQLQLAALPGLPALAAAAAVAALALTVAWRRPRVEWIAWPALAALAFAWTSMLAHERLRQALPPALEGLDVELTGVVASLPRAVPGGVRFVFEVEQARLDGGPVAVPPRLSLGWYRGWHDDALLAGPAREVEAGQRWRLTARLRAPHGQRNPHGFDFELWLFEQGIRATGYVRATSTTPPPQLLEVGAGHRVDRLRQRIRDALFSRVDDARAAGVLAGLAVGDQASIARADWDLFRDSGTAHLVAISGLHVTMFAWGAAAVVGAAWRRSPWLALRWPSPLAALWGGVAAAAGYALLAGWGVPARRTVWMLATAALLKSLGVRWPWPLVLAAAAVVVSVADPWALLQPGFWLSFVAVGLLMASEPVTGRALARAAGWRERAWRPLRGALRTQVVATVGLAPLTLLLFQQVSLVGLLANLVAIPLVTLLITPLALLGVALPPLWQVGAVLVEALARVLAWLTAFPFAVWTAAVAPWWSQAAGLLAALLLVAPLPWRLRLLALPLLVPLLWPVVDRPPEGQFELLVADVGQGSAVLVRTHGHTLLYDAGARYSRDSDAGQRVLVPLLRALGERSIDTLVLSHRDSDHVGGAPALMDAFPPALLVSSLPDDHPLRLRAAAHLRCDAGQRWQRDGVAFEVLHPLADDHARPLKANALSCVLRVVDARGRSALLTGDIEARQEGELLLRAGPGLRSDLLLVPHHGSRTSSTPAFVDAVAPQVALVQAGYRNRFGHPVDEVLARYAQRSVLVVRSDRCGAWTWRDAVAQCERQRARRYWHWAPAEAD
jgi:competence protein ComEC